MTAIRAICLLALGLARSAVGLGIRGVPDWQSLFDPSVPLLDTFVRGTVVYLGLLGLFRVVGQREVGVIGVHDLLVVVLVAEAIQQGLAGQYRSIPDGFLLVVTILAWSVLIDAIAWRWPRLGEIVKPRPKPLIEDGKLNRRVMRRELITMDEILSQLRLHGVDDVSQVKRAYIEPNGMISVIRQDGADVEVPEHQPAI
jgi:uncharacterized membrane protein YcaP (DUF421 family)